MSMQLCVLGSGSSGNCSLLRMPGGAILIDAGFGPRALAGRMGEMGAAWEEIGAILITHADRDHFNANLFRTLLKRRIRLYAHQRHQNDVYRVLHNGAAGADAHLLHRAGLLHWFDDQPFRLPLADSGDDPLVRPIHLAHDTNGTTGFRIETDRHTLGFATDLGHAPESLIEHLADAHIVALESNYDPSMQINSARPAMLKRRIMNGRGHLSNIEARNALRDVFARSVSPPCHVVLLHLSRQCNDPQHVLDTFGCEPAICQRLTLTSQSQPTAWLTPDGASIDERPGGQLRMFA